MMISRLISRVAIAFCLLLGALRVEAQSNRGPSTPEERAKAVEVVELLESGPNGAEANEATKSLLLWLIEIPDIAVSFCLAPLGSSKALKQVPRELAIQPAFSQAAFQILNPELESGSVEVYVAGVEGALRKYRAMRSVGAVAALKPFEELAKAKAAGELEAVVRKRAKKCK